MKKVNHSSSLSVLLHATLWGLLSTGLVLHAEAGTRILGVELIEDPLPFYDQAGTMARYPSADDVFAPMRVLLSRERYWAEDGHLDVVVQLDENVVRGGVAGTSVHGRLLDAADKPLAAPFILTPPGSRFVFYPAIPEALQKGGAGSLELVWLDASGRKLDQWTGTFRVEVSEKHTSESGSIRLSIPNQSGAVEKALPVTVGVPLPRGLLNDPSHLRLVSRDSGEIREIPVQVAEIARWSKYGSLKWVHLDFNVDLAGGPRELELQYGPDIIRNQGADIVVDDHWTFPRVDVGRLRFDEGLWYDPSGNGTYVKVLREGALRGAFVEHEDGTVYRAADGGGYEIEEAGPEKVVLRREGWYVDDASGNGFCLYLTRYIINRDSPLIRIFHTWIFTGDGNRDRIANMGWEFQLGDQLRPGGFLTGFEEESQWLSGDFLLQYDYDSFLVADQDTAVDYTGGRAPGVARAMGDGFTLYFGARDFWQNYPSELEFTEGSLWFHNWPRHNIPAAYRLDGRLITRSGPPALASAARHDAYAPDQLTRSEWKLNIIQARFAHEGELLDFRLPDVLAEEPIWSRSSMGRTQSIYWEKGNPESANAQGISRTEEMWLYLREEENDSDEAVKIMAGLNDHDLRAVVDPAWVARSGAFYEMHHQDWENYPQEEEAYELLALAPELWRERLGLYGMWIYGDLAIWNGLNLDSLEPSLYRAYRKRHHGWPYSWIPYARSGDPRLLQAADIATRQNIDANWCHFVSEDVEAGIGKSFHRKKGFLQRSTLPWATRWGATTRHYETKVDWLLNSWQLTGYHRARDQFEEWMELVKEEENIAGRRPIHILSSNRNSLAVLRACMEGYEASNDPWFLVMAHAIAEGHRVKYEEAAARSDDERRPGAFEIGHFWQPGDREYLRFTADSDFVKPYLDYADSWGGHWDMPSWQVQGAPMVESNAYAWLLTGDDYYLGRVEHFLDWIKVAVWDGDSPDYFKGYYARGSKQGPPIYTGWALQYFPAALAAVERAGNRLEPVPDLYELNVDNPVIAVKKEAGQSIEIRLRFSLRYWDSSARPERTATYVLIDPQGSIMIEGVWEMKAGDTIVEIPASAPEGSYRLEVSGAEKLVVSTVRDTSVPEVIIFEPGEEVTLASFDNQVWFYVPEGVERFQVSIPLSQGYSVKRYSIWGPDGERLWDLNYHRDSYSGPDPVIVTVEVEPSQAGKLWRMTLPDSDARFSMDTQIPPVFSSSRSRWFMPQRLPGR